MAQFRATIQGQRGEASRLGSKKSGLTVKANGWESGVTVYARVDADGNDVFGVWQTCGSNRGGGSPPRLLGELRSGIWEPAK